jgi:hypothetical protein
MERAIMIVCSESGTCCSCIACVGSAEEAGFHPAPLPQASWKLQCCASPTNEGTIDDGLVFGCNSASRAGFGSRHFVVRAVRHWSVVRPTPGTTLT